MIVLANPDLRPLALCTVDKKFVVFCAEETKRTFHSIESASLSNDAEREKKTQKTSDLFWSLSKLILER